MKPGTLYIVATPLGNLEDMTFRAIRILKEADLIAAEDTRHSKKLLDHYGIRTSMISCHEHNEERRSGQILSHLQEGKNIALITDAGTPCISDPGYRLVRLAAENDIFVIPVPGCSASIAGLSVSGLPTDSFLFCGFPPRKQARMNQALNRLKPQTATLVFYESPKRIKTLLKRAVDLFGNRNACLTREMTKRHEEYLRGSLSEILLCLETRDQVKGECVLFIQGQDPDQNSLSPDELEAVILDRLKENPKTSDLAKELAATFNVSKKTVYDTILSLKNTAS
ncbi:16S rRNA (cytidine(1402)-2'-O)-methyltransferase [Desulfospira joergensenii]|uniref:16S rRNA (cytidine(1402)-2'-O)-methyltransferase n=1 Tax=Desulfospira joergensenii TaxID=53329 RepID=UPI0003B6A739|nr:16S rRNA (cytidine(1402)-2'-O)-methyltransferase [Desulfospira joergensenii]